MREEKLDKVPVVEESMIVAVNLSLSSLTLDSRGIVYEKVKNREIILNHFSM